MKEMIDEGKSTSGSNRSDHMANERTFLAWIRTSVAIMAFGFVVEKFALFVRQLSSLLGKPGMPESQMIQPSSGHSSLFGIFLVGLGAIMGALAFIRYKKVEKEIEEDTYQSSLILDVLLTMSILVVGIFLMFYLIHSAW
jgi:putative membrane protein